MSEISDRPLRDLWDELVYAHERSVKGPASDRRTMDAYRNGLLTAYAIMAGELEAETRKRLMENEASR